VFFEKSLKISGRARAGGKPDDDDRRNSAFQTQDQAEDLDLKDPARPSCTTEEKSQTANNEAGVAGDGIGWGNGRVFNLMSVDTYRVDQASGTIHMIWTAPVACIITLIVLVINLGYIALAGFGLLLLGMVVLTMMVKSLFARRTKINKIVDQRVSLTQEILKAVRFIKYFGWENAFISQINGMRKAESHSIQVLLTIRDAIVAVSLSLPIFASMLSFITFSLTDHHLLPAQVFSSLALFNSLRMPLNMLPLAIGQFIDAWASLGRIENYLLAEDTQHVETIDFQGNSAIHVQKAGFTWERNSTVEGSSTKEEKQKNSKSHAEREKESGM